jgi:hypothetical protein
MTQTDSSIGKDENKFDFDITVYDYLNNVFDNHEKYLEYQKSKETDFNKQTWYEAKLSLIRGLREREIIPLKPFLQTQLTPSFIREKIESEYNEFRDINLKND